MNPGTPTGLAPQPYRFSLDYASVKADFTVWLSKRVTSEKYVKAIISTLDRFVGTKIISDLHELWEIREKATGKKYIVLALRNLLNYYEEFDLIDPGTLAKYRRILKVVRSNVDNYIPSNEEVIKAYNEINDERYRTVFLLLAVSGLRVIEGVHLINNFDRSRAHIADNFVRLPIFSSRGTKRSYYAYMPLNIFEVMKRYEITDRGVTNYFARRTLSPKYLRKWNYNFLIMHNVPESVADFIQGRSPVSIGSMHYLAKVKQADYWYPQVVGEIVKVFEP